MLKTLLVAAVLGTLIASYSCNRKPPPDTIPVDMPSVTMNAAWSPSGEQIAVCWSGRPPRRHGIYLIDTATWETTELFVVDDFSTFSTVNWSPDGQWLLFSYSAQIYKMKANGESLTQLTFTSRQFHSDWADSDTLIAYRISIGDSSGIWIMREDGRSKRSVVRHGSSPSFAEGDSILFIEYTDSPSKRAHLAMLNIPDSSLRSVYSWTVGRPYDLYSYPRMSSARQEIAWSIDLDVWTMTMDGANLRPLTSGGGENPDWSPDGRKIIYVKPTVEGGSLWIMNSDGSGKTPVPGW